MKAAPRTRVVNFRVTEKEYGELQAASKLTGRRCISDYVRDAVLEFGHSQPVMQDVFEKYLSMIDYRLGRVRRPIEDVHERSEEGQARGSE